MFRSSFVIAAAISIGLFSQTNALAQRYYSGSTPSGSAYSGAAAHSVRAVENYSGRTVQPADSPLLYPPRTIYVDGVYPSRTILNQATRGSVIEYTHNGNGSISTPGSSYQTVISSGPPIFPVTTVVSPIEPPVVIESRPISRTSRFMAKYDANRTKITGSATSDTPIQLLLPTSDGVPFSYLLNGTRYSIKSGYSHSFADDRDWIIEFASDGSRRPLTRYRLRAGVYQFTRDASGWDLKMISNTINSEVLPSPAPIEKPVAAPVPSPDL